MPQPSDAAPVLRQMQRQLMQMSGQLGRILDELDPEEAADQPGYQGRPRTEAILELLRVRAVPMTPVAIWRALWEAGCRDEKNLVRVTTYELWRRGRLAKVGRGLYCHPDHVPRGARLQQPPGRSSTLSS